MSVFSPGFSTLGVVLGLIGLAGCSSGPATTTEASAATEFYWSAARETYAAGDYNKTADHLERVIESENKYTAKAIPWYLVLTSGMAAGYMDLAEQYTAGARIKKANGLVFRRKATEYRTIASKLVLRFAQNSDKIGKVPLGSMPLAFPLPKGNAADPTLFTQIARGIELSPADAQLAESLAIEHSVLMTACLAAGAPNDVAKAEEILSRPSPTASRDAFGKAIARLLEKEAALFSRDKLDEPQKLAIVQARAQSVMAEGSRVGSARIVLGEASVPAH
jgi:hypothetical protein